MEATIKLLSMFNKLISKNCKKQIAKKNYEEYKIVTGQSYFKIEAYLNFESSKNQTDFFELYWKS